MVVQPKMVVNKPWIDSSRGENHPIFERVRPAGPDWSETPFLLRWWRVNGGFKICHDQLDQEADGSINNEWIKAISEGNNRME